MTLTLAARAVVGPSGGIAIIFAGLLATVSSANASIMASSRINLAMARDRMVPKWLSEIHQKLLTPYRAILLTGVLALTFLLIESLEDLAKIASVLQLYSYAALSVGCIVLRVAALVWYQLSYRTPLLPFAQLVAPLACIGIILYSGPFALPAPYRRAGRAVAVVRALNILSPGVLCAVAPVSVQAFRYDCPASL